MQRTTIPGSRLERMIGIVAASSVVNQENLAKSVDRFAKWGVGVAIADQVRLQDRYLAGPDVDRAAALDHFVRDPQIGTLWCARGGYGATRLFPLLEKWKTAEALARDPKLLIGFSDVTGLHLYFHKKTKLPSLHAMMPGTPRFSSIAPRMDKLLRAILAGKMPLGKKSHTASWRPRTLLKGKQDVEGIILGGNLTLLMNMIGTPWQPSLDGAFLFLEDCGERPYRVDRMLMQIQNAGMFKGLRGVLLGDFEADVEYKEKGERAYWKKLFLERFESLGIPVLENLPVGHGRYNEPLPLGVKVAVTKTGKILLLEQPVISD